MRRRCSPEYFSLSLIALLGVAFVLMPGYAFGQQLLASKSGLARKLSTTLINLSEEYEQYLAQPAKARKSPFKSRMSTIAADARYIVIDTLPMTSPDLLQMQLRSIGAIDVVAYGWNVSARLPPQAIARLGGLSELRFAQPYMAITWAGNTTSQGDQSQHSDVARSTRSLTGSGVIVGVLSDTYDCLGNFPTAANDVASGDLPGGVNVVLQSCPGSDEGRAMMQIIYDVAPGASFAFNTATSGISAFATGINALVAAGADIIVDDVFFFSEPMFQDGIVAQIAANAVAGGVAYFSAAGNAAAASYESVFRNSGLPGPNGGVLHDFDPGTGTVTAQPLTIPVGSKMTLALQWNQPFFRVSGPPGAATDVDIFLTGSDGSTIFALSASANIGKNPAESFFFENTGAQQGTDTRFFLIIENFAGPDPDLIKYMYADEGSGVSVDQFATFSGTAYGHAAAQGVVAVGAASYTETPFFGTSPPLVEPFSSVGEVPIFFQVDGTPINPPELRLNPEIVAPDNVNTTFFGNDSDGDGFPNFAGTSAAAPHAAGAAALLLEFDSTLTPAQIYSALEDSALDMDTGGYDFTSGHGLIQVDAALDALANAPPSISPMPGAFVAVGRTVDIPVSASDVGGGSVALSAPVLPPFCSLTDNADGSGTVSCTPIATDVGRHAVVITASDAGVPMRSDSEGLYVVVIGKSVKGDFDSDGKSDILWREIMTGQNWLYQMDAKSIVNSAEITRVADTQWEFVGNGDYNGDGKADILLRNASTGLNWMYLMNGPNISSSVQVNTISNPNWKVVGNGDYNGDGKADILLRNASSGLNWMYLMNGAVVSTSAQLNVVQSSDWIVAGSGDYNGDGKSDILWRNTATGLDWMYLMDGTTILSSVAVDTVSDQDWQVAGNGDYDGDGKSDILWRNSATGVNSLNLMNGATILSTTQVNVVKGYGWEVVGEGDYNGDMKSDILWRDGAGLNWLYLMDGATILSSDFINYVSDPNWRVINTQ